MNQRRAIKVLMDRLAYLDLQLQGNLATKVRDRVAEEASALRFVLKQVQAEATADSVRK